MRTRILATLLIITGVVVMAYPKLSNLYADWQQQRLVAEWQESFQTISNLDETSDGIHSDIRNMGMDTENVDRLDELTESTEDVIDDERLLWKQAVELPENVEGMLYIDKIELELPILHGATQRNMNISAASIEGTGSAGEVGNYAIAGHRSLTYGRHFNRLNELEEGDVIEVNNGKTLFQYTVTETLLVEPEDVWVLEPQGEDKEITLVTCDPIDTGTHRLIIKGKILN